jgi:hypothetical protein
VIGSGQQVTNPAGWLAIAAMAVLLQACADKPPSGPPARLYAVDQAGGAKKCEAPKVAPTAGQEVPAAMTLGNDGGWCAVTVANGGRPFDAGLLTAPPAHGKVHIHTVGNDTRIDYTPEPRFTGADAFAVRLLPGNASIRVSVSVGPA